MKQTKEFDCVEMMHQGQTKAQKGSKGTRARRCWPITGNEHEKSAKNKSGGSPRL